MVSSRKIFFSFHKLASSQKSVFLDTTFKFAELDNWFYSNNGFGSIQLEICSQHSFENQGVNGIEEVVLDHADPAVDM